MSKATWTRRGNYLLQIDEGKDPVFLCMACESVYFGHSDRPPKRSTEVATIKPTIRSASSSKTAKSDLYLLGLQKVEIMRLAERGRKQLLDAETVFGFLWAGQAIAHALLLYRMFFLDKDEEDQEIEQFVYPLLDVYREIKNDLKHKARQLATLEPVR